MNLEERKKLKVGDRLVYSHPDTQTDYGTVTDISTYAVFIKWDSAKGDGVWYFENSTRHWDYVQLEWSKPEPIVIERDKLRAELADYKRILADTEKTCAELRVTNESFVTAAREDVNRLREAVKNAWKQGAENRRLANAWEEDAKRFSRNETYYRDMLLQIAEVLGPEKFITDSGDIAQDVLVAKVPELARAAILGKLSENVKEKIASSPMIAVDFENIEQAVVVNYMPQTDGQILNSLGLVLMSGNAVDGYRVRAQDGTYHTCFITR